MTQNRVNSYPISIRNNLGHTVRVTVAVSSSGRNQDEHILITVSPKGTTLRDYYQICIDKDVESSKEWEDAGILIIEPRYKFQIEGKKTEVEGEKQNESS